jgi:hypothetical protein
LPPTPLEIPEPETEGAGFTEAQARDMTVDRRALLAEMAGEVKLGGTFLALAASSSAIATFGLLANTVAVTPRSFAARSATVRT